MDSFYGGRPGKDFQIKKKFTDRNELISDLSNPSASSVAFNEYAILDNPIDSRCELLQKMFAKDLDSQKDYIVTGQVLGYKVVADIRGRGIKSITRTTNGSVATYTITYTDDSQTSIQIQAYDVVSQSWAVGGTNSRPGEDTDNALYYSEQAANQATLAQSWARGDTNSRPGEDVDNARYYSNLAKASEESAAGSKNSAIAARDAAQLAQNQTESYRDQSSQSAIDANESAIEAQSWAVGGTESRSGEETDNAHYYSNLAKASKESAASSKNDAIAAKDAAQLAQTQAETAKDNAEVAEEEADKAKVLAESWAIGGTNSRPGEDTDNAFYYSQQATKEATSAESWAIGGTDSRIGEDTDNSKYYSIRAESWAVGGTSTRTGEDSNNARYYSEQAGISASDANNAKNNAQSAKESAQESAIGAANSANAAATSASTAAGVLQDVQNAKVDTQEARDDAISAKETAEAARDRAIEARDMFPKIINGMWYIWDPKIVPNGAYTNTGVKATGTLKILGCFHTYEELKTKILNPQDGDAYGVGDYTDPEGADPTKEPGEIDVYIYGKVYDSTAQQLDTQWINLGKLTTQEDTWILLPKKELQG